MSCALLLALITVVAPALAHSQPLREPQVEQGFQHFYNLEYDQAIAAFQEAVRTNPAVPDLHNHLAQSLLFREMFRNGALESELVSGNNAFLRRARLNPTPQIENEFLDEVRKAMGLAQDRLKRNPDDTAAMYSLGISYGLRANYYWVVKKSWRDSLRDATSARKLHNRISEIDPRNIDARLVQGVHDYIVGSLPFSWRMFGFLVGIHGDKEKGIQTLQDVATNGKLNSVDAQIFLGALYRRENQPSRAVPLIQNLIGRFPRNFLLRLELAQMYSMAGNGKAALEAVDEVARMKTRGEPGFDRLPWEKVWFQAGIIQFWYNDLDRSLENMRKVTAASNEIDLNTGVQAWLRMGQIYDMTHRRQQALEAYRRAIAQAPEADAAQESKKYLSTPYRRGRI
jgi:tetratricopeptide (TPR) repeat protein